MKSKKDFVTNSSTTCFVVYGVIFDEEDFENDEKREEFEDKCYSEKLKTDTYMGYAELAVGIPVDEMKEDETVAQFKQRVCDVINQALGKNRFTVKDIGYIERAYRDG